MLIKPHFSIYLLLFSLFPTAIPSQNTLNPKIISEGEVYTFQSFNNGSGPMWCRGNTSIVRIGGDVFASGLQLHPTAKPLNNCIPILFKKMGNEWQTLYSGDGRTREPCPLVRFDDSRIFLSNNPTLTDEETYNGPSQPTVLEFDAKSIHTNPVKHLPKWDGKPEFSEHSYRTFAADGTRNEILLMQNILYAHAEWAFMNNKGEWSAQRQIKWPYEEYYDKPQSVRLCYPVVALKDRQVFFAGVSDIIEPYDEWRNYKHELTGQKWDYDFRRLFFTYSDDITTGEFKPWIELASRDKTAGWITPWDMYVHDDGTVFVLWTERAIDERLRDTFFPNEKQRHALEMAIIKDGKVIKRTTVIERNEGEEKPVPGAARFHKTDDNRLFVFYYASGSSNGKSISTNFISEIMFNGNIAEPKEIKFEIPFSSFFTATIRAGNQPSAILDLFGQHGSTMRYAGVQLYH